MKAKIFKPFTGISAALLLVSTLSFSQQISYVSKQYSVTKNGGTTVSTNDEVSGSTRIDNGNQKDLDGGLTKTYSKSYPADADDQLKIDNMFGKVTVNTWNKAEFKVDVVIKVSASDPTEQQQRFDRLTIDNSKEGNDVSFKTNLGHGGPSHGSNNLEINYTIYMPAKNALNIKNQFGAIELPDLEGKVTINSQFGGLRAKSLPNAGNDIKISHGSFMSTIAYLKAVNLSAEFADIKVDALDQVHGNFSFNNVKIGRIINSAQISLAHSSGFEIENIDKDLKSLNINASYTSVRLNFKDKLNADFDVKTSFGDFKYNSDVEIVSKTPADSERGWSASKNYTGHLGKGDDNRTISVHSSFSSVKFE